VFFVVEEGSRRQEERKKERKKIERKVKLYGCRQKKKKMKKCCKLLLFSVMKKKCYGVFGEEKRGLQNNLVFSISPATVVFFFLFGKNIKWPLKLPAICKMALQSFKMVF
jgi:hypothetical protein